jgi:spore coat polysaccharide biosynthesis protein SpsF
MIYAIIQARLNSSRFPGKVLAELAGQTVLAHVVNRVRQIRGVDHIVVATHRNGGEAIAGHCEALGVECFIHDGAESDVLGRFVAYLGQCKAADGDLVVRVCADSPLLDPGLGDELIAAAVKVGADYTGYQIDGHGAVAEPTGMVCEVVKVGALRHAEESLTADDPMREHVTQVMYRCPKEFRCYWLPMPEWYTGEHWAVDRPEDLERIEEEMVRAN